LSLPQAPLQPPWIDTADGRPRGVGIELETLGLNARETAALVHGLAGGRLQELSPYRLEIIGSVLGDITVELDLSLAHPPEDAPALGARSMLAGAVGLAASMVTPVELIFEPLPPARLPEIDRLVAALQVAAPDLRPAGPHLNPEVASVDPDYLLAHLRAFSLLGPGLRTEMGLAPPWRIGFVTSWPPAYRALLADPGYRPDLARLIADYLDANPTRYRELDMLPLFALLAPQAVAGRLRLQKIKPRPVFHWRLPGARPYAGVVADWNRWVEVERLAADPERLTAATRTAGEA
jgi:hypothetical protein